MLAWHKPTYCSSILNFLLLLLLCWLGTSQHTVLLFNSYYYYIIIIIFSSERFGASLLRGFKATSTKLGRDLGPDVKFEDLSFQTDQTYSFFIMNYLM